MRNSRKKLLNNCFIPYDNPLKKGRFKVFSLARLQPRVTAFSWVIAPVMLTFAFYLLIYHHASYKTDASNETPSLLFLSIFFSCFFALCLPKKWALPLILSALGSAFYYSYPLDLWNVGIATSLFISFYIFSNSLENGILSMERLSSSQEAHSQALSLVIDEKNKLKEEIVKLCSTLTEKDQKLNDEALKIDKILADSQIESHHSKQAQDLLKKDLSKLESEINDKNKEIEEFQLVRNQLDAKQKELLSVKEKVKELGSTLNNEESIKQAIIQEMAEHIDNLEREKGLLENTLSKLQGELEVLQEPLAENMTPSEFRRITGVLNQLREQFEEKSKILDNTRKELFHTQEELNFLKNEKSEWELNGGSIMTDLLSKIEEEQDKRAKSEDEIIRLEELISNLISRKT